MVMNSVEMKYQTRSSSRMHTTIMTMNIQHLSMFSTLPVGWWRKLATCQAGTINYGAAMLTIRQLRSKEYLQTREYIQERAIEPLTILFGVVQNTVYKQSVRTSAKISGGKAMDTQNIPAALHAKERERLVVRLTKSVGIRWLLQLHAMTKHAKILPQRFNVHAVSWCTNVLKLVNVGISGLIRKNALMLIGCANKRGVYEKNGDGRPALWQENLWCYIGASWMHL